mmetsp:Transcript_13756/g.29595  ORF Transcript_13756/g.29595 Transcript_13756/m.29595 type:complete len:136 (-) Transcript_13756:901-1308(-)
MFMVLSSSGTKVQAIVVPTACACPRLFKPICAEGETFPNMCEAECHGLASWHEGECTPEEAAAGPDGGEHSTRPVCTADTCDKEYAPVCGEDRLTYLNVCIARCSGVMVSKLGICSTTMVVKPHSKRLLNRRLQQ